jgi:hypothetical protein
MKMYLSSYKSSQGLIHILIKLFGAPGIQTCVFPQEWVRRKLCLKLGHAPHSLQTLRRSLSTPNLKILSSVSHQTNSNQFHFLQNPQKCVKWAWQQSQITIHWQQTCTSWVYRQPGEAIIMHTKMVDNLFDFCDQHFVFINFLWDDCKNDFRPSCVIMHCLIRTSIYGIIKYIVMSPSFSSSLHSNVTSNWKGCSKGDGLSSTTTLLKCILAITTHWKCKIINLWK